jgi:hypothetical protein
MYFISLVTVFFSGFLIAQEEEGVFEVEGGRKLPRLPLLPPAAKTPSVLATTDGEYPDVSWKSRNDAQAAIRSP